MTYQALLHGTGEISIPLLLVRNGELSPRQCDHEFSGKTGDCPTCKEQIAKADFGDGSSFASAMALLRDRGVGVSYRKFGYGSDGGVEPWRVCTWAHPPGYWTGVEFRDCSNPDTNTHRVHLEVIRRYYAKFFPPEQGFVIKVEQRLRKPGDPPRPYSPDLAIYGPKQERMVAVEYQRSHEAYEKFADRDQLRLSEGWAAVDWWLDDTQPDPDEERQTVYSRSRAHRDHLIIRGSRPIRCWVDPKTLKLQAEYGKAGGLPPDRRKRIERHIEKAELNECSTFKLMQQLEGEPERKTIDGFREPLRPLAGSEVNFREDLNYSLERERRVALAAADRQRRLDEQDRRHREWEAKQRRLDQIRVLISQLGSGHPEAGYYSQQHTIEELDAAIERLTAAVEDHRARLAGEQAARYAEQVKAQEIRQQQITAEQQAARAARQQQREEEERYWEELVRQEAECKRIGQWGIEPGTVGVPVQWQRGKTFNGLIVRWQHDRPVIQDTANGKTRWAYSSDDYRLLA